MGLRKTMVAFGVLAVVGGCAAAQKQTATGVSGAQCSALSDADRHVAELYTPGAVQRVEPVYRQQVLARAIQPRYVAGAKLYVPAQHGMNEAYLERVLSCHAAASSSTHPNDPLRADNIRDVDVESVGQHFVVAITGHDRASGKDIYQRAKALRDPSTSVEVRQLSAAPHGGDAL